MIARVGETTSTRGTFVVLFRESAGMRKGGGGIDAGSALGANAPRAVYLTFMGVRSEGWTATRGSSEWAVSANSARAVPCLSTDVSSAASVAIVHSLAWALLSLIDAFPQPFAS
eukprot:scaffold5528_cov27-Tisochrysis_lutea.AAC.6